MKFIYKAKKGPEEIVEGVIEAVNQENAVTKIREMGLFPVTVRMATDSANKVQVSTVKKDKPLAVSKKNATKGRVSKKHIYLFTKKLKVLIKSQEP
ncbi:MAG: hypothetical protein KJ983_04110, partial [Candidatus Omnitrophica bacterium]|nr:hypothetical protein [Candidatus Omnitrophota bacterium]